MSKPLIDQYQGQPTLCLNPEARYKFSFGVAKAKMILEHLETIKAFVANEGASLNSDSNTTPVIPLVTPTSPAPSRFVDRCPRTTIADEIAIENIRRDIF